MPKDEDPGPPPDESPDTPTDEPKPEPVQDPPSEPDTPPYVVRPAVTDRPPSQTRVDYE
jgi:hypothetical protein